MRPATQFLLCWLAATGVATAQTIDLQTATAQTIDLQTATGRRTIDSHVAGAAVASWLHVGDLTGDYWTKELIVGAPDEASGRGTVRLYLGRQRVGGDTTTATADVVISGASPDDRFGAAGDAGYVTNREVQLVNGNPSGPTPPRDLLVGAPGALRGRGIVYVFAGPFNQNTPVAVANAVVRITGAPQDHLGSQVESADLNGDGFREVILPVPSSGIVYVVDVHNAGSSSIDLSVAVPGTILTGLGSSIAVAAGDMTGDSLIDLAVGSPYDQRSRGAVYLFVSRSRVLPASIALPAGADGQITGEEPGDQFGASLWVADIDDDGNYAADLLVGAPGSDGPENTRRNAGAVYVVWGSSGLASTFRTGLVLHGAAAGHRLGTVVTSGNVTRRNPHDVVALAPGANGGFGEVFLYYGRHVFEFPSSGAADLATAASRRVLSDETAGMIRTVRAWEVTGEGAEEIVVGVPDAATTAGGGAGRLYIALSPRLELSTTSATMRVTQCVPGVQEIEIRNPSVIAIPWQLYDPPSWAELQPATGTTVVGSPARVRLVVRTSGMAPGTYSQQVIVRSAGPDVGHAVGVNVQLTVDPPARLRGSSNVDFTGDGCGDLVVFAPGTGVWRIPGGSDRVLGGLGDVPVPGDYDGDLLADPAVFHRATATWNFADGTSIQHGQVGDLPVASDYDGNGTMDIAVYRPSTAMWLIRGQPDLQWGRVGDVPVPADYDGDGAADVAVYRPATGEWIIRGQATVIWGNPSDIPVPADYDGDGRADLAVFDRATQEWRVQGQFARSWGRPADIPMPFDVDRDGRAELVTFRRSNHTWNVLNSATNAVSVVAGAPGDVPAQISRVAIRPTRGDFDGDGRSEIAVWRPGDGQWHMRRSQTDYAQFRSVQWGAGVLSDIPIRGDFDGDGTTDIAVWRPRDGMWHIRTSSSNYASFFSVQWGAGSLGDIPITGDFDGDGRTDFAVWRPGPGDWHILTSSSDRRNFFTIQSGAASLGDVPVPADYDGDGRTDIAVWRATDGFWHIRTSSSGYREILSLQWGHGSLSDVPMPGDFDGDGRSDIAVWRPGDGYWHVRLSTSEYRNFLSVQWGAGSLADTPLLADFDGDGRTDIAVWRPRDGMWHVRMSSYNYSEFFSIQWGAGVLADRPVLAYRP